VIAAFCNDVVTAEGDVNGLRTGSYMPRIEALSRSHCRDKNSGASVGVNNDGRFDAVASRD
jgi:hypothetical protein